MSLTLDCLNFEAASVYPATANLFRTALSVSHCTTPIPTQETPFLQGWEAEWCDDVVINHTICCAKVQAGPLINA